MKLPDYLMSMGLAILMVNRNLFMTPKFFKVAFWLLCGIPLMSHAAEYSDNELLSIGKAAFARAWEAKSEEDQVGVLREDFKDLNQAQRTRAMMLMIYDLDKKTAVPGGNLWPSSPVKDAMRLDRELLTDASELKRMISMESDPRKFYILTGPAMALASHQNEDFVQEMSHFLFIRRPVINGLVHSSEYYVPGMGSASSWAYAVITRNLKLLGASFVPPDEDLPFDERIPILVSWLRENWPGCENLGLTNTGDGPDESSRTPEFKRSKAPATDGKEPRAAATAVKSWYWILGVLLAAFGAGAVVLRKRRMGSGG